ncbi:MAG: VIT1/CCC1 transporter family protein [Methanobrevibacter sp.]|jgi:antitoxin component HigA of HigAB toxin-antitoxin module|nr:VIT1/CCC1 transporter family protein [Candidatus Methanovirga procula]
MEKLFHPLNFLHSHYFKGILFLSIIVLGVMLGPAFHADPSLTKKVSDQHNIHFMNYINKLPKESTDPILNLLEYIKKRAGCNDWEAAQINALMAMNSEQKQGYDYYSRYMMGNTTAEEDNADYYRTICEEWDQLLDEYAKMTPEQRAEELMTSATNTDVTKILNESSPEELDYIQNRTEPYQNKLEDKANELASKSTWWMIEHLSDMKNAAEDINRTYQYYNEEIVIAHNEYQILENSVKLDGNIDEDAYPNALRVRNKLKSLNYNNTKIVNSFLNNDPNLPLFRLGDLVQYRINDSSEVNFPVYKYLMIKNDTNDKYGIDSIDLIPRDAEGNKINESGKDIVAIHKFQHERIYIPKNSITPDNSKYAIQLNQTGEWAVSELYSIYDPDVDPTGLEDRLNKVPTVDESDRETAISELSLGVVGILGGGTTLLMGIVAIVGACAATPATAGLSAIGLGPGMALLFSGIAGLVSGFSTLSMGIITIVRYNKAKKSHNESERDIFNDLMNHNRYPEAVPIVA